MPSFCMNKYFRLIAVCLVSATIFFSCSKELSYETSIIPVATVAAGTLKDTLGNCLTITPKGSYFNGVAIAGDTDYVQITVNVKTTGSYNIQTALQNGFQFAGTGVFNNTGIQTINLKASGTPAQIASTNFTVTFDSASCPFTVSVQDSTGHGGNNGGTTDTLGIALNKWQFDANGHTYAGNIISAQFTNLIGANLVIAGTMASGSTDTAFGISVEFTGTTLDTGTYATSDAGTNFSLQIASGANIGNIIFAANATSSEIVNITILNYTVSSKTVSGTFSGISYDFNGNDVPITNGKFKATVQ
jgi:hypothetical protein